MQPETSIYQRYDNVNTQETLRAIFHVDTSGLTNNMNAWRINNAIQYALRIFQHFALC